MDKKDLKFVEETLGLTSEILEPWKEKISLKKFKIGELILNNNKLSKSILILLEGKIRIRGFSENKKKIFSLGVVEPFEIIGFASNLLKQPIEIVSAGSDCIFLSVAFEEWSSFKKDIDRGGSKFNKDKIHSSSSEVDRISLGQ